MIHKLWRGGAGVPSPHTSGKTFLNRFDEGHRRQHMDIPRKKRPV
jgi:hypothetical protein